MFVLLISIALLSAVSAHPFLGSLTADASANSQAQPAASSGYGLGGNFLQAANSLTNMQKSKVQSSTETEQTAMSMTGMSSQSPLVNLGAIAPALSQLSNTISQTKTETKQSLENAEVTMMQQGLNIYESGLRDGIKAGQVMAEEGLKAGAEAGAQGMVQAEADAAQAAASAASGVTSSGAAGLTAGASAGSAGEASASSADANAESSVSASTPGDLAASSGANAGASVVV